MSRHDRVAADRHNGSGWSGETYYGQPALKNPHWDWKVSGYVAVAALSGAAQALSWIGGVRDPEQFSGARRSARMMALAGSTAGAALLIADLKTPQRFYNMLRILRPTSPMSFGTYIFGAFATSSAVSALGELPAVARRPALRAVTEAAQAAAALSGAGIATYTAALMSATSNPYWAAAPRGLGAQFATSAVASGAAALALCERFSGRSQTAEQLENIAAVATVAHLAATATAERGLKQSGVMDTVANSAPRKQLKASDLVIAGAIPLAAYALSRASGGRAGGAAIAGSCAVLVGGWLMRHGILNTGKESVQRPEAGFRLAQPRHLSEGPQKSRRTP